MINNQKYKISTLAKDLNMKSKDLLDLFIKLGMTDRKHSSVVEPEEFNVVLELLTAEKQISNFDDYMAGKVTIDRVPTAEELAAAKAKLEAEKAEAERLAAEKAEAERLAAEKAKAEEENDKKKRRGLFGFFNRHS